MADQHLTLGQLRTWVAPLVDTVTDWARDVGDAFTGDTVPLLCRTLDAGLELPALPPDADRFVERIAQGRAAVEGGDPGAELALMCSARRFAVSVEQKVAADLAVASALVGQAGWNTATTCCDDLVEWAARAALSHDPNDPNILMQAANILGEAAPRLLDAQLEVEPYLDRWDAVDVSPGEFYRLDALLMSGGDLATALRSAGAYLEWMSPLDPAGRDELFGRIYMMHQQWSAALAVFGPACLAASEGHPPVDGLAEYVCTEASAAAMALATMAMARDAVNEGAWHAATACRLERRAGIRLPEQPCLQAGTALWQRAVVAYHARDYAEAGTLIDEAAEVLEQTFRAGDHSPELQRTRSAVTFLQAWIWWRQGKPRAASDALLKIFGDPESEDPPMPGDHPLADAAQLWQQIRMPRDVSQRPHDLRYWMLRGLRRVRKEDWVALSHGAGESVVLTPAEVVSTFVDAMLQWEAVPRPSFVRDETPEIRRARVLEFGRQLVTYLEAIGSPEPAPVEVLAAVRPLQERLPAWLTAVRDRVDADSVESARAYLPDAVTLAHAAIRWFPEDRALLTVTAELMIRLAVRTDEGREPDRTETLLREAVSVVDRLYNGVVAPPGNYAFNMPYEPEYKEAVAAWQEIVEGMFAELATLPPLGTGQVAADLQRATQRPVGQIGGVFDRLYGMNETELLTAGIVYSEWFEYLSDLRVARGATLQDAEHRALRWQQTAAGLLAGYAFKTAVERFPENAEAWINLGRWVYNFGKKEWVFGAGAELAPRLLSVVRELHKARRASDEQFGDALRMVGWNLLERASEQVMREAYVEAERLFAEAEAVLTEADRYVHQPMWRKDLAYAWHAYHFKIGNMLNRRRVWKSVARFGDPQRTEVCVGLGDVAPESREARRHFTAGFRYQEELDRLEHRPGHRAMARGKLAMNAEEFPRSVGAFRVALGDQGWPASARNERLRTTDLLLDAMKATLCNERPAKAKACRMAREILELTGQVRPLYPDASEHEGLVERARKGVHAFCEAK